MHIVITGADGFIGKNLQMRLGELGYPNLTGITRSTSPDELQRALTAADFVFHLAGVNRPQDPAEFASGNGGYTASLCAMLAANDRRTPVVFASSTQAELPNAYGESKRAAEEALQRYSAAAGAPTHVFRLTNVFGKWARPNYNSAVATFCHNITRGLPVTVNDPSAPLRLVYVDDVVKAFVELLAVPAVPAVPAAPSPPGGLVESGPVYETTVGEVVALLREFAGSRSTLLTPRVGTGLVRALYSTYISYLPPESFAYPVPNHADPRGVFVEMLKTPDTGQFSYFTAHPGITRGGHYHHSKTEKFLVIKGQARFKFRHMQTGQAHELITGGDKPEVVETVPGWTHDITNIGTEEMIVMLWANEVFDRDQPDTFACAV